jgi:hypothetical protein
MPDAAAGFVYASAGLLSPRVLSEALSDVPRSAQFAAGTFAPPRGRPPSQADQASNIETAFSLATDRFDAVREGLDALGVADLRERWLLPLLHLLDFDPQYQRAHLPANPEDRRSFAISHLGWQDEEAPPLVLDRDLDRAHDELQEFLVRSAEHTWGLASDGVELRILRDFHHSRLKAFVAFDLAGLFEARDFAAFRALYRLAHASRFVRSESGDTPLEGLFKESVREGVQVGRDLQPQIRTAIEALGTGLLTPALAETLGDGVVARRFYAELLRVVYRMLFMLFAEQRRMLPPDGVFADTYSLTRLRDLAERGQSDPRHEDLWEGLKASFRLLQSGSQAAGVFAYDGRLFEERETPIATAGSIANRHVLRAVKALTTVEIGGLRQYVDYAHLGVEELGAVYESLLPYALRLTVTPLRTTDGHTVPGGSVYLDPVSTERADLGAHYTRPELVDFVLELSLDRLIAERLQAAAVDHEAREAALLGIRVLDPACGSGAFLVGAIDRLAAALAAEREGVAKPTERGLQDARRDVLQHCIYGVDKDLFAVELCKVALWIHCAVKELPLTFLDHRIQHGDSLVGWPLLDIPAEIPEAAFDAPSGANREVRLFLASAQRHNEMVLAGQGELYEPPPMPRLVVDFPDLAAEEERIPSDVARKAELLEEYMKSATYERWRRAADVWTAAFFWGPASGPPPTTQDYRLALGDDVAGGLADAASAITDAFPAFHWALRFHGVRETGGFDCILGNPPWEQFENREDEWFAIRAPEVASLAGARRKAAIEALATDDPELFSQWQIAAMANVRLAEYSRNCGRYTAPGGKANTYLLFTELAARMLQRGGRAGLIVKTALAVDNGPQAVFQRLLESGQVEELHDIVNGGPTGTDLVFTGVDAKERFAVVALRGQREPNGFEATLMNWNVTEATTRPRQHFTPEMLSALNPHTRSLTSFRRAAELEVALAIHRRLPILDFEDGGANPWGLKYATLFNSTTDSDKFHRREDLEGEGWVLGDDKIFRLEQGTGGSGGQLALPALERADQLDLPTTGAITECCPVYEGQLAHRYDHRAKTYEGYLGRNKYGHAPGIPQPTGQQQADPCFEIEPRYWMARDVAERRIRQAVGDRMTLGFRDVGAPWRNQRSAKAALLPRYPVTDTLPVLGVEEAVALEFTALFNSTPFDFLVRGHMPGAHVKTTWMLSQVAAPVPGLDRRIGEAARKLSLTSYAVARLFNTEPHPWDPEERYALDVAVDAMVAHAYGLTKAHYEIILDSFEVMAREQIRVYGHYKFKEDCLDAYDHV